MKQNFTRFAFTDSVKEAQEHYGNLHANSRASLILVDYPSQQRLKIWAESSITEAEESVELFQQLAIPEYDARIERLVMLTVQAYDWNCPRHITPRYTIDEFNSQTGK